MLKIDRQRHIETQLKETGSIVISDTSLQLACSEETVRRDLKEMEAKGMLKRIHGGAFLPGDEDKSAPLKLRERIVPKEEDAIAQLALEHFIENNDILILDSSSTCYRLAKMLIASDMDLTVITNSLSIISLFEGQKKNIKLIGIGGRYKGGTHSFVGAQAVRALSSYVVKKSFISCSAIDLENGLLDNSETECEIRSVTLRQSKTHVLLVDHTKFSDLGDYIISPFSAVDAVITDRKPDNKWMSFFDKQQIAVCFPTH